PELMILVQLLLGLVSLAVTHYRLALTLTADPPSVWWYRLGLAQQNRGQVDDARQAFRTALNTDPRDRLAQEALQALGPGS
ncbi:MAG: tetratricopeptide repeat protein, partial [Dehalococcoidia bacterium]|nr:tetratricopeptide repeat protein [Dehalococcoidia bacterium]